ncbi:MULTISPECIES: alpha/beta fold hydrolase [Halomonadaceae]|uniref:Pimeloyl-[acyl-carrier protein] methyl ester esterase n=1 Tax=Vreelandella titanicae TaxID=664683 RepID=A0AAP9NRP3_9GAMM|nr:MULTISPECIES: alpha/beta fold hydrolase [Halomonas]QKS26951.1 Pimeloyl-[acyl-carrier protein] methyl ester esterase [Halomonas titanicae]CDG51480.1 Alpha/beta hydrolase [Halomonas sp. A3H3]SDI13024.1 pimeloyl-[acyl-carrier protein] methyl ester esterase [Halomonas titanicae]|tara:strand:- start:1955 stop:2701 length:747 start_codon:yes stop_codon:yes gene_type:complete
MQPLRLILLSGWGIGQRIWQPLEAHWPACLAAQAVDWPGYGDTPPLEANAALQELADTMAEPLASDAVWVGWSLGGLLATALLAYLPPPRGLILLGAGETFCVKGKASAQGGVTSAELSAFQRAFQRDPTATWQHFLRWQTQGEPGPRQVHRQLRDLLGDTPPADSPTLATGLHWLATIDNRPRLAAPPCPVVRLIGDHDPFISPAQRRVSKPLSDVGHCPMLSQPQALAATIGHHAHQMVNATMAVL